MTKLSCDAECVVNGDMCPECEITGGFSDGDSVLEERDGFLVCPQCGWACEGG